MKMEDFFSSARVSLAGYSPERTMTENEGALSRSSAPIDKNAIVR